MTLNSSAMKIFLDFLENVVITITSQQQTAAKDLLSKKMSDLPSINCELSSQEQGTSRFSQLNFRLRIYFKPIELGDKSGMI